MRSRQTAREGVMPQSENRILNALPQNIFAAFEPHLRPIVLEFGEVIAETDQPGATIYFPYSGVVSLVVEMKVGEMIETAMVGRDGVVNGTSALDGKVSLHKAIIQVAGKAVAIKSDELRSLANEFEPLRAILIRHEQVLFSQAHQSAGCNASHSVEARMCKWLLRIRDLTGSDDMPLTQEFLAQMLGVTRPSVSVTAGILQRAGFIKYSRGHIRLMDTAQLEAGACECYETVKGHYERLLTL
jgi:CRP-like cAMP-binding protein